MFCTQGSRIGWAAAGYAARSLWVGLLLGTAVQVAAAPSSQPFAVVDEMGSAERIGGELLTDRQLDLAIDTAVASSPRASREIGGILFENEPEPLLNALFLLVGRQLRDDAGLQKRHPDLAGRGVRDAVARLFGAETGRRLVYLLVRHRYNASHLAFEDAAPWRPAELDQVIAALRDLPASARPYDPQVVRPLLLDAGGEGLARFAPALSPGVATGQGTLLALSGPDRIGIRLSGLWQASAPARQRAILVHELAHDIVRLRDGERGWAADWQAAAARDAKATGRASHVSRYAATSWTEDMAESVAAYRYRPARLKSEAPHRYALLRDRLFGGREYRSN